MPAITDIQSIQKKSVVITKGRCKKVLEAENSLTLGDKQITIAENTKHLGLIRSVKQESKLNVLEKISLARRTLYALLNVGVHGNTGLNPKISYKIYQCYVLPRLLSGIEAIPLNKSELNELELFHRKTLKSIQSLPPNTASSAVLLPDVMTSGTSRKEIPATRFSCCVRVSWAFAGR